MEIPFVNERLCPDFNDADYTGLATDRQGETLPRQQLQHFKILLARFSDYLIRQDRRGQLLVPGE
jgi:hypothetical protein